MQKYFQKPKILKELPWKHAHHDVATCFVWINLLGLKSFLKVNKNNDKKKRRQRHFPTNFFLPLMVYLV